MAEQHTPTDEAQRKAFMEWYRRETGEEATLKASRYFAFTKTADIAFKAWCAAIATTKQDPAHEH